MSYLNIARALGSDLLDWLAATSNWLIVFGFVCFLLSFQVEEGGTKDVALTVVWLWCLSIYLIGQVIKDAVCEGIRLYVKGLEITVTRNIYKSPPPE